MVDVVPTLIGLRHAIGEALGLLEQLQPVIKAWRGAQQEPDALTVPANGSAPAPEPQARRTKAPAKPRRRQLNPAEKRERQRLAAKASRERRRVANGAAASRPKPNGTPDDEPQAERRWGSDSPGSDPAALQPPPIDWRPRT